MQTSDAVSLSVLGVCELHSSFIQQAPKWQLNSPAGDALPSMCHTKGPAACSTPFTFFQRSMNGEREAETESQQAGEGRREEGEVREGRDWGGREGERENGTSKI